MACNKISMIKKNRTHVSMKTNIPIIKHWAFFKTFTFNISANNEDISVIFIPDTYDHILISHKIMTLKVKVQGHSKGTLV